MIDRRIRHILRNTAILSLLPVLVGVTGCSETQLAAHLVKAATAPANDDGTYGTYKVGTPYQINGVTYYPKVDPTYNRVGIASWYGTDFHGKPTANGDIYDMNAMTAAHTTLPMPTKVRVTNLENGRSVILTVNDRGPFVKNRIIDVSRRAAQILGFALKGTAQVRVEAVSEQDETTFQTAALSSLDSPEVPPKFPPGGITQPVGPDPVAGVSMQPSAPPAGVTVARKSVPLVGPLPAANSPTATPVAAVVAPTTRAPAMFVQGGAFRNRDYAEVLQRAFFQFGPTEISPATVDGKTFYRVRLGPVYDSTQAELLLAQVVDAGHPRARLIID